MASSQIKSEPIPGPGPSGFPFAWNSPPVPGTETVITTYRSDAQLAIMDPGPSEATSEFARRLFPSSPDADDSEGIRLGHFTIQHRLGIGGMGSVFLAMDEQLRRNVALKVLSPSLTTDPAAVLRFQNEARAAARLDHDNIARIFFYGECSGLHYIAYEYIPGSNLRDVIRAKERLAPAEAVNYSMQLAAALSHTSAAGVIHRDIKPSNVLITPQGRAKLVDLGLARKESAETSAEITVAGTTLGTFDYISPEQAKDPRTVDVRSDIYSLGCTLYHMLTGEPPYPEGTVLQKLLDHQGKEPPDPARKNRRVPPALSAIVRKMMASDPRRRYATPARLLSDLLKVARLLGSGAVPIDGQVWLTATRSDQPFWQGNVGWIATAAALLTVVIAMERYPELTRRLDPRVNSVSVPPAYPPASTSPVPPQPTPVTSSSPSLLPLGTPTPRLAAPGVSAAIPTTTSKDLRPAESLTNLDVPTGLDKNRVPPVSPTTSEMPPELSSGTRPTTLDAPSPTERPLISIGPKSYSSLEAACSEAKDGAIIELRYNGRRGKSETPIRLTNKENITIRSAIGYRPVIEFAPADSVTEAESRMITVSGGSLHLVNVDLVLNVPQRITADRWAVFSLERPRELQLHDVTVSVDNPAGQPACVIEHRAAPGQVVGNMGIMKNGSPIEPPSVSAFDCLFRGPCDFVLLRDAVSARFQLKDVVVAVQGSLLHAWCQSETSNTDNDRVLLDLESVTSLASDGLVLTEGVNPLNDYTPPLSVSARDCVFSTQSNRPLVAMMDAGDLMEMQRRFVWTGDRNHYDAMTVFWQLGGRQGPSPARQLDFEGWRSYWGAGEGTTSINAPVKWRLKSERNWARFEYPWAEIEAPTAPGTRIPGANLNKLPAAPGDSDEDLLDAE